jgi:hypothetical protein
MEDLRKISASPATSTLVHFLHRNHVGEIALLTLYFWGVPNLLLSLLLTCFLDAFFCARLDWDYVLGS